MTKSSKEFWRPQRPVSKGASAYHEAVVGASWHINNIEELIKLVKNKIKNGDIVVDFGAGTGASAVYFLKKIKKNYKLWLVDNSPSWLGKAYNLLQKKKNVDFLIIDKIRDNYRKLNEIIGD